MSHLSKESGSRASLPKNVQENLENHLIWPGYFKDYSKLAECCRQLSHCARDRVLITRWDQELAEIQSEGNSILREVNKNALRCPVSEEHKSRVHSINDRAQEILSSYKIAKDILGTGSHRYVTPHIVQPLIDLAGEGREDLLSKIRQEMSKSLDVQLMLIYRSPCEVFRGDYCAIKFVSESHLGPVIQVSEIWHGRPLAWSHSRELLRQFDGVFVSGIKEYVADFPGVQGRIERLQQPVQCASRSSQQESFCTLLGTWQFRLEISGDIKKWMTLIGDAILMSPRQGQN